VVHRSIFRIYHHHTEVGEQICYAVGHYGEVAGDPTCTIDTRHVPVGRTVDRSPHLPQDTDFERQEYLIRHPVTRQLSAELTGVTEVTEVTVSMDDLFVGCLADESR
jgi:hypothetical protein